MILKCNWSNEQNLKRYIMTTIIDIKIMKVMTKINKIILQAIIVTQTNILECEHFNRKKKNERII